jgi:urea transporter
MLVAFHKSSRVTEWVDAILLSYASIIFSRRRDIGVILVVATFNEPALGLTGIVGVILSLTFARIIGFAPELWRSGFLSFNALLGSLGVAFLYTFTWQTAPIYLCLLFIVSITSVVLTVSLNGIFRNYLSLPILSWPFVLVAMGLCFATAFITGHSLNPPIRSVLFIDPVWLPEIGTFFLRALGNLFFQNNVWAGLLIALAILLESRISFLLSFVGLMECFWLLDILTYGDALRHLPAIGFNCVLTGVLLGGILLVPSLSSFLYATLGIFGCVFIGISLDAFFKSFNIPPLAIPFNVSALLMLYALRFRTVIRPPFLVDFIPGSPEENLEYHLNRFQRLGLNSSICMRLPFLGKWTVTQPPNSEPTHQPPWQHAWDFEVTDGDAKGFRNSGSELSDYYAYDLPVIAPADGMVVQVVDDVPDNPIGEFNGKHNWGNLIMLAHGHGIYSLVSHLRPQTAKVKLFENVRQGQLLGRCGNSGRSPVPHLHFHVQRSPQLNAPTCPSEFVRYIEDFPSGDSFRLRGEPSRSTKLQNFSGEHNLSLLLCLQVGQEMHFKVRCGEVEKIETWKVQIDLYSNLFIQSSCGAKMYFCIISEVFTAINFTGSRQSALYGFFLTGSRIPFHGGELRWEDRLPIRYLLNSLGRFVTDILRPFGEPLRLCSRSKIFRGTSKAKDGENPAEGVIFWTVETQLQLSFLDGKFVKPSLDSELSFSAVEGIVALRVKKRGHVLLEAQRIPPGR